MKGELPFEGLPIVLNITSLHFACNAAFRGTIQEKFEVHVTALNSSYLLNLNTFAQEVAREEYEGFCLVYFQGFAFFPAFISHIFLKLGG